MVSAPPPKRWCGPARRSSRRGAHEARLAPAAGGLGFHRRSSDRLSQLGRGAGRPRGGPPAGLAQDLRAGSRARPRGPGADRTGGEPGRTGVRVRPPAAPPAWRTCAPASRNPWNRARLGAGQHPPLPVSALQRPQPLLADPDHKTWAFKAVEAKRIHVEESIRRKQLRSGFHHRYSRSALQPDLHQETRPATTGGRNSARRIWPTVARLRWRADVSGRRRRDVGIIQL